MKPKTVAMLSVLAAAVIGGVAYHFAAQSNPADAPRTTGGVVGLPPGMPRPVSEPKSTAPGMDKDLPFPKMSDEQWAAGVAKIKSIIDA